MQVKVEVPERRAHNIHQEETRGKVDKLQSRSTNFICGVWCSFYFRSWNIGFRQELFLRHVLEMNNKEDPADVEFDNVDHGGHIVSETSKEGPESPKDNRKWSITSFRRRSKRAADDYFKRAVADLISQGLVKNQEILFYSSSKVSYQTWQASVLHRRDDLWLK